MAGGELLLAYARLVDFNGIRQDLRCRAPCINASPRRRRRLGGRGRRL